MRGIIEHVARRRIPCAVCPAVPIFVLLCSGILMGDACCRGMSIWAASGIGVSLAILTVAGSAPLRPWRALVLPLGIGLVLLHHWAPWQTVDDCLPQRACRTSIRAIVTDLHCTGDELDPLPPVPTVTVRLTELRLPGTTTWQAVRGRALVLAPDSCPAAYGDSVIIDGVFLPAEEPAVPGCFAYREYLRRRGIPHLIRAQRMTFAAPPSGWRRALRSLLDVRDTLAMGLVAGVSTERNAEILLAMTFGFRRQLLPETRARFLRSGAIHIFAVSGLHVGIISLVMGAGLRLIRVPYRWRCGLLPLMLGAYVLMTGGAPSAVRAWLMLSLMSLSRLAFRALSPINVVAAAGCVLLVLNPLGLFQSGFVFSFTIVSVLILGWPLASRVASCVCERDLWIPRRLRPGWRTLWIRGSIQAMTGGILAWLGSTGLVLYTNGLIVPAALLVNIGLSALATATLALALPKAMLALLPIPGLDALLGGILNGLLAAIGVVVDLGSVSPGSIPATQPHILLVTGYYLLIALILLPRRHPRIQLWAAVGACCWILLMAIAPRREPSVAVLHGADCDIPVVVVEHPDGLPPLVIHSGTRGTHRELMGWMQRRGHRQVGLLVFPWNLSRGARAAPMTVSLLEVATVMAPPSTRSEGSIATACRNQLALGGKVRTLKPGGSAGTPNLTIQADRQEQSRRLDLTMRTRDGPVHIVVVLCESGHQQVLVERADGSSEEAEFTPILRRRLLQIPLRNGSSAW